MEQTCTGCSEVKPLADFYWDKTARKHQVRCKKCILAYRRVYAAANRERVLAGKRKWYQDTIEERRAYNRQRYEAQRATAEYLDRYRDRHLRKAYGIGLDEYRSMLAEQDGRCAICRRPESDFTKSLSVDHCHETGRVRSLLCGRCNTHLGWYEKHADEVRVYLA